MRDYSHRTVLTRNSVIDSLPVLYSSTAQKIDLYLENDLTLYLPNDVDIASDLTYGTYLFDGQLTAPLKRGDIVGELVVSHDGKILATIPLTVREDVERSGFLYFLDAIKNYVTSRAFIFSCLTFACLMFGFYLYFL